MLVPSLATSVFARDVVADVLQQQVHHPSAQPAFASGTNHGDTLGTAFTNGGSGKAGSFTRRDAREDRLSKVLCAQKDCSSTSDWLTSAPNAAVAWAIGGLALLFSFPSFTFSYNNGWAFRQYYGGFVMLQLCVCLFLRASLDLSSGDKRAIAKAMLFFNYNAGLVLVQFVATRLWLLGECEDLDEDNLTFTEVRGRESRPGHWRLVWINLLENVSGILVIVGVCKMFGDDKQANALGMRLVQVALVLGLVQLCSSVVMLVVRGDVQTMMLERSTKCVLVVAGFVATLWCVFMTARAFLPLDNVTRTNEVIAYLLNYALIFVGGASLTLFELGAYVRRNSEQFYF
ncbi:hypothetical protein IWW55_004611 [Coemansia sp. RSA 2706]|nr:hypothetical protein IWW55_004611 [Coemansia sp. RSA 2706]KAJ2316143.1 hypothetical protein IWW52_003791 [Coemansia sp. RSA 2704]KAJ2728156.1 hypothetical protein H4R23_003696 [Coemansia sp. Cherry 401B]